MFAAIKDAKPRWTLIRWKYCVLCLGGLSLLVTCGVYQRYNQYRRTAFKIPQQLDETDIDAVNRTEVIDRISIALFTEARENWIVVTTIAGPSLDIQKLASIPNWQLLVVGDLKTPKDWNFPGCIFLSVEQQLELDYDIVKHLPYNSYTRKNIGYLYAINHGAKFIYDTDDDNHPLNGLADFHLGASMGGLIYDQVKDDVVNPYAHFGQPSIWPRGYPLERVQSPITNTYKLGTFRTPTIQQGLVNGDPDVDAIFRLTRKRPYQVFTFDPQAPPVTLPRGVFAPFNSQNTLFSYDAFWSLCLPASVAFRVTDIWRGYWAQRLTWLVGQRIAFFPPNAFQKRNAHSYLKDFQEEQQFYVQTSMLVQFLTRWQCRDGPFFSCVSRLGHAMAEAGFWNSSDALLIDWWLSDLRRIGYREPPLEDGGPKEANFRQVYFSPNLQGMPPPTYQSNVFNLQGFCSPFSNISVPEILTRAQSKPQSVWNSTLLVIVFHNPFYSNIGVLQALYGDHFSNIVYCGQTDNYERLLEDTRKGPIPLRHSHLTFINITSEKGYFGYECAIRAIEMNHQSIDGYLVLGDDVLLNFWNLPSVDLGRAQMDTTGCRLLDRQANPRAASWPWWETNMGKTALDPTYGELEMLAKGRGLSLRGSMLNSFQRFVCNSANLTHVYACLSDIYYISRSDSKMFAEITRVFLKHRVFLEITVPTVIMALHSRPLHGGLFGINIWDTDKRQAMMKLYNSSAHYLHPIKFSNMVKDTALREAFCGQYWYSWLENW